MEATLEDTKYILLGRERRANKCTLAGWRRKLNLKFYRPYNKKTN
ncbi:hypothetical protein [Virgibacillus sp. YIM 98842]|nr:hypothetical protein [Virgibacillus sp. YIM 98842]